VSLAPHVFPRRQQRLGLQHQDQPHAQEQQAQAEQQAVELELMEQQAVVPQGHMQE
jgi:hypothetical protein